MSQEVLSKKALKIRPSKLIINNGSKVVPTDVIDSSSSIPAKKARGDLLSRVNIAKKSDISNLEGNATNTSPSFNPDLKTPSPVKDNSSPAFFGTVNDDFVSSKQADYFDKLQRNSIDDRYNARMSSSQALQDALKTIRSVNSRTQATLRKSLGVTQVSKSEEVTEIKSKFTLLTQEEIAKEQNSRSWAEKQFNISVTTIMELQDAAQANGTAILLRPVNTTALTLMKQGAVGKNMSVHGKSADESSLAEGLIPINAGSSKAGKGDQSVKINAYNAENQETLKKSKELFEELQARLMEVAPQRLERLKVELERLKAQPSLAQEEARNKAKIEKEIQEGPALDQLMQEAKIPVEYLDRMFFATDVTDKNNNQIYVFQDKSGVVAKEGKQQIHAIEQDGKLYFIDKNHKHNSIPQDPPAGYNKIPLQVMGKPEFAVDKEGKLSITENRVITADIDALAYGIRKPLQEDQSLEIDRKAIYSHYQEVIAKEKSQLLEGSKLELTKETKDILINNNIDDILEKSLIPDSLKQDQEFTKLIDSFKDIEIQANNAINLELYRRKMPTYQEVVAEEKSQLLEGSKLELTKETKDILINNNIDDILEKSLIPDSLKQNQEFIKLSESFKNIEIQRENLKDMGNAPDFAIALTGAMRAIFKDSVEISHAPEQFNIDFTQPLDGKWVLIDPQGTVSTVSGEKELLDVFTRFKSEGLSMPPNPNWGWELKDGKYEKNDSLAEISSECHQLALKMYDLKEKYKNAPGDKSLEQDIKSISEALKFQTAVGLMAITEPRDGEKFATQIKNLEAKVNKCKYGKIFTFADMMQIGINMNARDEIYGSQSPLTISPQEQQVTIDKPINITVPTNDIQGRKIPQPQGPPPLNARKIFEAKQVSSSQPKKLEIEKTIKRVAWAEELINPSPKVPDVVEFTETTPFNSSLDDTLDKAVSTPNTQVQEKSIPQPKGRVLSPQVQKFRAGLIKKKQDVSSSSGTDSVSSTSVAASMVKRLSGIRDIRATSHEIPGQGSIPNIADSKVRDLSDALRSKLENPDIARQVQAVKEVIDANLTQYQTSSSQNPNRTSLKTSKGGISR